MNALLKPLIFIVVCLASFNATAVSQVISGKAPDFTLSSNQGNNLRLEELRGQVVLLNFWASWCGPCRQEMPILDELHKRYERAGFKVLGVNVEPDSAEANRLLKKIPVTFPILYDTDSTVSKLYDVQAMPTTVLIDRDGNQRFLHKGYKPGYEKSYRQQIKQLIRE
jgi:thiol-disulfide isomerase/thioredoxin